MTMSIAATNTLDLNGEWSLFWSDGMRGNPNRMHETNYLPIVRLPARVPGEVHLDLMREGLLDNIYEGANVLKARWVEESVWAYEKIFTLPPEAVGKRCTLEFSCLDYTAEISVNGKIAGRHANVFRPCRLDVTHLVREGENRLVVRLESGLFEVSERPISQYMLATTTPDQFLYKRIWLRKPQSSFGWDWAPRLVNVGIQGPVCLYWDDGVRVNDSSLRSSLSDDFSLGRVTGKAIIHADAPCRVLLSLALSKDGEELHRVQTEVALTGGEQEQSLSLTIDRPSLWYPIGYGEPTLYDAHLTLTTTDGTRLFSKVKQVGFRKAVIDQSPHPDEGYYFVLTVNNIPIFVKGANMVPADMILAHIDRARYETLIARAKEANMNFLRVWGGGVYESDDFYELCDREGILVWQEFIFACATYPATNKAFLDEVKREVAYQVRRLCSHPSLVVWCGNNEIDGGVQIVMQGDQFTDYALYHQVIPSILQVEDPERYYQPSSPYSSHSYVQGFNLDTQGDQHPWYIGTTGGQDFFTYRSLCCRFADEGGFLGPNSLPALHACMEEEQRRIGSFSFAMHDNMMAGAVPPEVPPDDAFPLWYGRNLRDGDLEDYCYLGGFLQGEAFGEYIANFRRRKFDSAAAVFWMYNDCWDCSRSWTVVDYRLNRTPSFYPVRRAFAPVAVFLVREGDHIQIYGVNDTLQEFEGTLTAGLCISSAEKNAMEDTESNAAVRIPANQSVVIGSIPLPEDFDPRANLPFAMLQNKQGDIISRARLFEVRYHEFTWSKPTIELRLEPGVLIFKSDVFAAGVCVDLDGDVPLGDNFFDLYPGEEHRIVWPEGRPLPRVRSLADYLS